LTETRKLQALCVYLAASILRLSRPGVLEKLLWLLLPVFYFVYQAPIREAMRMRGNYRHDSAALLDICHDWKMSAHEGPSSRREIKELVEPDCEGRKGLETGREKTRWSEDSEERRKRNTELKKIVPARVHSERNLEKAGIARQCSL
jgi:hypothetical protein